MKKKKLETSTTILRRLRRVEGQIKGIQKMVEDDKHCEDILIQIAAVRAAINKVGGLILENHSVDCINNIVSSKDKETAIDMLNNAIQDFVKFKR